MRTCHLSRSWMVCFLPQAVAVFIVLLTSGATPVLAQDSPGRFELGGNFTALHTNSVAQIGPGLEGDVNFGRHLALDSAFVWLPQSNLRTHAFMGLFGAKVGTRTQHFGFFGKVRPGFASFSHVLRDETISFPGVGPGFNISTRFATLTERTLDLGGVMEYYPARHWAFRWDFGDTLFFQEPGPHVVFINVPIPLTLLSSPGGTTNNFQFSTGVHYRF